MTDFFRFPHTPHLVWLGSAPPRDDKVMPRAEANALLSGEVTIEEKLDGANLGISVDSDCQLRFQNRGEYLVPPFTGQFARLNGWAGRHGSDLTAKLGAGLILFGEWCAARHSVAYDALPDWFAAFDVYDRSAGKFWSVGRRIELVMQLGIAVAPRLSSGRTTLSLLIALATTGESRFGHTRLEGLVVRRDGPEWLEGRAKLVRPSFLQNMDDHWRRRHIEWNRVIFA